MKKLEEMRANMTTKYADQIFVALLALLVIFPNSTAIDFWLIVPQKNFQGKLHGDVTLEWRGNSTRGEMDLTSNLEITCVQSGRHGYVYYRENGVENARLQNKDFNGRVEVNQEALRLGKIEMTIVNLTIEDKGIYQCEVTIAGRERYEDLELDVISPYTPMKKKLEHSSRGTALLTCETEGFPETQISWSDDRLHHLTAVPRCNFSIKPDKRVRIISVLTVDSSRRDRYRCTVVGSNGTSQSAFFVVPDDLPILERRPWWVVVIFLFLLTAAAAMWRREQQLRQIINQKKFNGANKTRRICTTAANDTRYTL